MLHYDAYFETLCDVLETCDEDAALALLPNRDTTVLLVTDELTAEEALGYAKVLMELGRHAEAEDVLSALLRSSMQPAQGAQQQWRDWPQAAQA